MSVGVLIFPVSHGHLFPAFLLGWEHAGTILQLACAPTRSSERWVLCSSLLVAAFIERSVIEVPQIWGKSVRQLALILLMKCPFTGIYP